MIRKLKGLLPSGFSHNPFMMGYDSKIYDGDDNLGFVFPKKKLITPTEFVSVEDIIENIEPRDRIVINMGDSSTSGWNSNRIYRGNKNPNAPFFTYKTYSQLMEEQTDLKVVNGGVPGYSSLQGKKYLEQLLRRFASEGIDVDFTTFYFGNNDATYNKEEDKVRLNRKKSTPESDGYRVSVEDYRRNLRDMVETTRDYDARPILIMPVVHYDWEPCIRSGYHKSEFGEALDELADKKVRKELERALREFKAGNYGSALELDMVLPRIKLRYQHILREIAREMNVPLIDIQAEIPRTDNSEYFADYCHPLEPTNQMITDKFFEVTGIEKGQRRTKDAFKLPLKYRILEGVVDLLGCFVKHKSRKGGNEPPSRIYTTY